MGGDTGPLRLAAASGAATVGLFGPTWAGRYGIAGSTVFPDGDMPGDSRLAVPPGGVFGDSGSGGLPGLPGLPGAPGSVSERADSGTRAVDLQGLPGCPHRRPVAITEQPCWWTAACPLSAAGSPAGPACMADVSVASVARAGTRLMTTLCDGGPPPRRPAEDP
ncbi:hypothetical protein [Microbispora amethystogenes]|uniref:hypothetical protein n=1 Tax=Microbispora amethystogenes TaxID=1427754 RepID=UPI001EF19A93|nr:hypothetical protein [Microbispora amethystogenes]